MGTAGKQLLAGAGFTLDQHRQHAAGKTVDSGDLGQQRRMLPYDVRRRGMVAKVGWRGSEHLADFDGADQVALLSVQRNRTVQVMQFFATGAAVG